MCEESLKQGVDLGVVLIKSAMRSSYRRVLHNDLLEAEDFKCILLCTRWTPHNFRVRFQKHHDHDLRYRLYARYSFSVPAMYELQMPQNRSSPIDGGEQNAGATGMYLLSFHDSSDQAVIQQTSFAIVFDIDYKEDADLQARRMTSELSQRSRLSTSHDLVFYFLPMQLA